MPYPTHKQLLRLGAYVEETMPDQETIDAIIEKECLNDISWETEVWIAESPTHLIHFNGERFLGPYEE
jgi:hypothetical protein